MGLFWAGRSRFGLVPIERHVEKYREKSKNVEKCRYVLGGPSEVQGPN